MLTYKTSFQISPPQLQRAQQLCQPGITEPGPGSEPGGRRIQQPAQATADGQQLTAQIDCGATSTARAQEYGQQLRITQRFSTTLEQLFPRPFAGRPVTDRHIVPPPAITGRPP